jgi:hypothetical protein
MEEVVDKGTRHAPAARLSGPAPPNNTRLATTRLETDKLSCGISKNSGMLAQRRLFGSLQRGKCISPTYPPHAWIRRIKLMLRKQAHACALACERGRRPPRAHCAPAHIAPKLAVHVITMGLPSAHAIVPWHRRPNGDSHKRREKS